MMSDFGVDAFALTQLNFCRRRRDPTIPPYPYSRVSVTMMLVGHSVPVMTAPLRVALEVSRARGCLSFPPGGQGVQGSHLKLRVE